MILGDLVRGGSRIILLRGVNRHLRQNAIMGNNNKIIKINRRRRTNTNDVFNFRLYTTRLVAIHDVRFRNSQRTTRSLCIRGIIKMTKQKGRRFVTLARGERSHGMRTKIQAKHSRSITLQVRDRAILLLRLFNRYNFRYQITSQHNMIQYTLNTRYIRPNDYCQFQRQAVQRGKVHPTRRNGALLFRVLVYATRVNLFRNLGRTTIYVTRHKSRLFFCHLRDLLLWPAGQRRAPLLPFYSTFCSTCREGQGVSDTVEPFSFHRNSEATQSTQRPQWEQ